MQEAPTVLKRVGPASDKYRFRRIDRLARAQPRIRLESVTTGFGHYCLGTGEYNTRMPAVRPAVTTLKYFKVHVHVAIGTCRMLFRILNT